MTTRKLGRTLLVAALALSLVLSITGGTIAWFTDEVESANNVITSGNLDAKLYASDDGSSWTEITTGSAPLFTYDKWEPGYTTYKYLKIENAGNLAFKYQLSIIPDATVTGDYKLADVIDVYTNTNTPSRDNLGEYVGTLNTLTKAAENTLEAGDYKELCIVLKMQESAGNDYQGLSIGNGFSLQLLATQATVETDGFGTSDYDKDATYSVDTWSGSTDDSWINEAPANTNEYVINTADQLADFSAKVNAGQNFDGKTVKLNNNIDLGNRLWTPIGTGNSFKGIFDGQGYTVSNFRVENEKYAGLFGNAQSSKGGVQIKNVNVKDVSIVSCDYAGGVVGWAYATMENCHAENVNITVNPYWAAQKNAYDGGAKAGGVIGAMGEGNTLTVNNCSAKNVTINGYRDLGGVVGMLHNNNRLTKCSAEDVQINYIIMDMAQYDDGNTPNQNAGKIYGRINAGATTDLEAGENDINPGKIVNTLSGLSAALKANGGSYTLTSDIVDTVNVATNGKATHLMLIADGQTATIDLNGHDIICTAAPTANNNYSVIQVKGDLNITGEGSIIVEHTGTNMAWNALSAVISVEGGNVTLGDDVVIENKGGSDMAFGVDVNTTLGQSSATINGATVKSPYTAVRIFNNHKTQTGTVTLNSGVVDGDSRDIWVHNPSANAVDANGVVVIHESYTYEKSVQTTSNNSRIYQIN